MCIYVLLHTWVHMHICLATYTNVCVYMQGYIKVVPKVGALKQCLKWSNCVALEICLWSCTSELLFWSGTRQQESVITMRWLFIDLCETTWSAQFVCSLTDVPIAELSLPSCPSHGNGRGTNHGFECLVLLQMLELRNVVGVMVCHFAVITACFFWSPLFRGIEVHFKNESVTSTGNLLGFLITAFIKERIKSFVHPLNFSMCFFHVSYFSVTRDIS